MLSVLHSVTVYYLLTGGGSSPSPFPSPPHHQQQEEKEAEELYAERERRETRRKVEGNVEFVHPDLKAELNSQDEDPNNPWVWLTSYSRIPVGFLSSFLSPVLKREYISAGGHPGFLFRHEDLLSARQGGTEGLGRVGWGAGYEGGGGTCGTSGQ